MKSTLQEMNEWVIVVMVVLGLIGVAVYFHLAVYRDVAPRYAQVERRVFTSTPSYIQGKIGDLVRYRAQYKTATSPEHRATMREVILGTAATVDRKELPADLREFLDELQRGEEGSQ